MLTVSSLFLSLVIKLQMKVHSTAVKGKRNERRTRSVIMRREVTVLE